MDTLVTVFISKLELDKVKIYRIGTVCKKVIF